MSINLAVPPGTLQKPKPEPESWSDRHPWLLLAMVPVVALCPPIGFLIVAGGIAKQVNDAQTTLENIERNTKTLDKPQP